MMQAKLFKKSCNIFGIDLTTLLVIVYDLKVLWLHLIIIWMILIDFKFIWDTFHQGGHFKVYYTTHKLLIKKVLLILIMDIKEIYYSMENKILQSLI